MPHPPIHPGASLNADHAAHILAGLKARTLPKDEWTHGAHLTAAVLLLDEAGLTGALTLMPDMIRSYNEAVGGVNSDTEGYHHTITVFYLCVIDDFCRRHEGAPAHARATALLGSPLAAKDYALQFYSTELLFSVEARRSYVEPDLKSFPGCAVDLASNRR